MRRAIRFALLSLLAARAVLALPPLAELEAQLARSPQSQMADQAYESMRAQLRAGRLNLGVSLYGNAALADNRDVIDPTQSYSYREAAAGLGFSVPVLGSRLQLQSGLDDQKVQLALLDARRDLQRRDALQKLRKAYASYWQGQRTQLLAEELLADEPVVRHALDLRTRAGLLLDSDRLQLESGFDLARRDSALAAASQSDALDILRALTDSELEGGIATPPVFTDCDVAAAADTAWMSDDPELVALLRTIEVRSSDPRSNALYPVQSSLKAGYQSLDEINTGQHGSSAAVTLTFQMPIEYASQRRLYSEAAAAELARARLEYEIRRKELQNERRALIEREAALRGSVQFASARYAATDAAVEERRLRAGQLAGDVVEGLLRARTDRYNAAKALTEAQAALALWYADWSRFDGAPCSGTGAAPSRAAPRDDGERRTLYVWRTADWLADTGSPSGDAELGRLRAAGVSRLLVSLDAQEMSQALRDPARLTAAVEATKRRGVKVGLLLGDPSWIEAAHREQLLDILRTLKAVPFDAVHLDLEPEQLEHDATSDPALFAALVATLQAVADSSAWPVELSTHPRNLDVQVDGTSFADVLRRLQIEPTLMVYVANPERVAAIVEPLLRRYPHLRFRVALSLERSAPGGETLQGYPEAERQRRIAAIEQQLRGNNFDGVALELEDGWSLARSRDGG